jgi:hypothetical protein
MLWRAFPVLSLACLLLWPDLRQRVPGIVSVLAYCTLLHALTHAEVRLSEPLHPLLVVVTSGALAFIWQHRTPADRALS